MTDFPNDEADDALKAAIRKFKGHVDTNAGSRFSRPATGGVCARPGASSS